MKTQVIGFLAALVVVLLGLLMMHDGLVSKGSIPDRSTAYAEGCDEGTVKNCSPSRTLQLRAAYLDAIQLPIREFQVGEGLLLASVLGPLMMKLPGSKGRPNPGLSVLAGAGLIVFVFCAVLDLRYAALSATDARGHILPNPLKPMLNMFYYPSVFTGGKSILGVVGFGGLMASVLAFWKSVGWKKAFVVGLGAASLFLVGIAFFDASEMPIHATNFVPWAFDGIDLISNTTVLVLAPILAGVLFLGGRH